MLVLTTTSPRFAALPQSTASSPSSSPPPSPRLLSPRPYKRTSFSVNRQSGRSNGQKNFNYSASASSPDLQDSADEDETEMDVRSSKSVSNGILRYASAANGANGMHEGEQTCAFPPSSPWSANAASMPRPLSPSGAAAQRRPNSQHRFLSLSGSVLFPKWFEFRFLSSTVQVDTRRTAESLLLIIPFVWASLEVVLMSADYGHPGFWILCEFGPLLFTSCLVFIISGRRGQPRRPAVASPNLSGQSTFAPARPQHGASRDMKLVRRSSVSASALSAPDLDKDGDIGHLYMTEDRDYRECVDSGVLTALLLGPFLACASILAASRTKLSDASPNAGLGLWRREEPLPSSTMSAHDAVIQSRFNLVQLASLCSLILIAHLEMSRRAERRSAKMQDDSRSYLPESEIRRLGYYVALVIALTSAAALLKLLADAFGVPLWSALPLFDIVVGSLFYQFCMYVMVRLARRGFTLGELAFVAQAATALFMETVNLTISRIWPVSTPFIKTFRLPTPLLIFQLALIPGSLLAGFLLSPLLVLSRNIAQKPSHRLRFPEQKQIYRRSLAAGVYAGFALVIGGVIGTWTQWCLGWRNPWVWAIYWLIEGKRPWSRLALLIYWGSLGSISVAGWNRQLARQRRYRHLHQPASGYVPTENIIAGSTPNGGTPLEVPHLAASTPRNVTEILDAADKHVPTLGLNARRKFFHALAVCMFLPGIAFDPAFTHLSFSAAFALFAFAEYVRYFALYPFGAAVHVFLSEFLDHRDSGTAILSHFYLLTGCAGSVWLEGPSAILGFTGVLVLGIGDALASVVGKRVGRHRWSPASPKTVEGSAAFAASVIVYAWVLRVVGFVEPFSAVAVTVYHRCHCRSLARSILLAK